MPPGVSSCYMFALLGEYGNALNRSMCSQSWLLVTAAVVAVPGQIPTWTDLSLLGAGFLLITFFTLGALPKSYNLLELSVA